MARLMSSPFPRRPWSSVAVHLAVREGVASDLMALAAGSQIPAMLFERLTRRLVERAGLAKGNAAWAVSAWAEALGLVVPEMSTRLRGAAVKVRFNKRLLSRPKGAPWNLRGHRKGVTDIDFNMDGSLIATGGLDRTVRLWDTRSGEQARVLMGGHRDWVRAVAFSPDGKQLASAGDDGAVRLWDPLSGERKFRLAGHEGWVRGLCWSPDSRIVVSAGRDGFVCLWEAATLQQLARLGPFEGGVSRVTFDLQGRWLAIGRSNGVEIWDLDGPRKAQQVDAAGARLVLSAGPDDRLYIGDERGAWAWSVREGRFVQAFDGHGGAVRAIAAHPNGLALVTGGRDQAVRLWTVEDAWEAHCFQYRGVRVSSLAFHPGGHIGIGFSDGNAQFREMERGGTL